ncbi:MAG TPA: ABC transporter permease [Longimicrobium sp.]|jgi:ABC-2 type transport system permease protein
MRTILFLVRKEYLHVFRDRATVFQVFAIPIIQLLVLANAATFEVKDTRVHVVDLDRTRTSRELVSHFAASGHFVIAGYSASPKAGDRDLLARRATMVLQVPPNFERDLVRTGTAPVQLVLNAEEGAAAGITRAYGARILTAYAGELGVELRPGFRSVRAGEPPPVPGRARIEVRSRGWYNPELDYRDYMVPGILVALVTIVGTLLTAQNIAREKEMGTLEQLNVTPVTRAQFIAGKLLPFWLLALVELALGLALARLVFHVPMRGSLLLVFAVTAVYLVAALGIGLWISTLAETQQQAMFVTFFILVVYLLLGGIFTPVDSMPGWVQALSELNPVKHFVAIMRAVLVKGAGFAAIQRPFFTLVAYASVVFLLAVRQYSKTSA